jgi:hypothetical protein
MHSDELTDNVKLIFTVNEPKGLTSMFHAKFKLAAWYLDGLEPTWPGTHN